MGGIRVPVRIKVVDLIKHLHSLVSPQCVLTWEEREPLIRKGIARLADLWRLKKWD